MLPVLTDLILQRRVSAQSGSVIEIEAAVERAAAQPHRGPATASGVPGHAEAGLEQMPVCGGDAVGQSPEQTAGRGVAGKLDAPAGAFLEAGPWQHHAVTTETRADDHMPIGGAHLHSLFRVVERRVEHREVVPLGVVGRPIAVAQPDLSRQPRTQFEAVLDVELHRVLPVERV